MSIKVHIVKSMTFPVLMYGRECWTIKKAECWRTDVFELWYGRRLLRVPWTVRRSNQSILKETNPEYTLEGLMLKLKLQYLAIWCEELTHWKDPDAGKDWEQVEKGMTEDQMVGWHHRLNGYGFEQALGVGDGQARLACCSPWSPKILDMTEWLNWTDRILIPQSGIEPRLLTGQHGVLTTGLLRNSFSIVLCVCVNCISMKKETVNSSAVMSE